MPFGSEFDDVYRLGIKAACEQAGAYAERVDEQIFQESILERIYNQIAKADVIVSDMSGRNPNVFYETGYAHALGKSVILLTRDAADIPFDLKHYPHIVYGGRIIDLLPELEKRVRWAIENPGPIENRPEWQIQIEIFGKKLVGKPEIQAQKLWYLDDTSRFELRARIGNVATKLIKTIEFKLAFVTSVSINSMKAVRSYGGRPSTDRGEALEVNSIFINDEARYLHLVRPRLSLMPGEWDSLRFEFENASSIAHPEEAVVRILTDIGEQSFPFILIRPSVSPKKEPANPIPTADG